MASDPPGRSFSQFLWHEVTRSISTPPGWDANPSQGYLSIKFAGMHFYSWVERVKALSQEHDTMSKVKAKTRTAQSGERWGHHTLLRDYCSCKINICDSVHFMFFFPFICMSKIIWERLSNFHSGDTSTAITLFQIGVPLIKEFHSTCLFRSLPVQAQPSVGHLMANERIFLSVALSGKTS